MAYSQVWDLDVFFPGGSGSEQFAAYIEKCRKDLLQFDERITEWQVSNTVENREDWKQLIDLYSQLGLNLFQCSSFVECLEAQNMKDVGAKKWRSQVTSMYAQYASLLAKFDEKLAQIAEADFQELMKDDQFKDIAFVLTERRLQVKDKLSVTEETLIEQLSIDGYHGWSELYDSLVGFIQIPFEENGEKVMLSAGQAANKLAHPDKQVRMQVQKEWENAWAEKEELFAHALNHLGGFRLGVYEKRGWENVLKEPLEIGRMKEETLNSMWAAIVKNKELMVSYLNRKASLLGVDKLSIYDIDAPVLSTADQHISYDEGAQFILKHFASFGEKLTAFTKIAFEDRWIEAEDRSNKRPGGFCTDFPNQAQSRIFMTYSGTSDNVSTLAHELGHAFHSHVMKDVHPLNTHYAMNVAETASTFAEMIVLDAAYNEANSKDEQIAMLDTKIQGIVAFCMNIHARFLFETKFYEERKQGVVAADQLNELMVQAQQEAYCDALGEYHPHFWASKLHFYISSVPFYNFPYTFGYLFSRGIYEKAVQEGKGFEEKYIALLKDTGCMSVEELAMKHLQIDLAQVDFWEESVQSCLKDIELFLQLTE